MKTVKMNLSKEVLRVSDDDAIKLVSTGVAHYVPKSVWKAIKRGNRDNTPQPGVSDDTQPK